MAHELTLRADGRAEMAFVGQTPWHGLGQQLSKGASIGVWQKEAGMDWIAKQKTPFFSLDRDECGIKGGERVDIPDHKVIYRSDTNAPLSIVSSKYQVVQPREVLEFFRDMVEQGGWHIHTAGTLRGGRKLWAMASNGEGAQVNGRPATKSKPGDEIMQNLLLATSLDGSMKTTAMLTAVRVVCANTLALALSKGGKSVRISHRSAFDPMTIKQALGVAQESFTLFMNRAREMAETPINTDEAMSVLRDIFGQPKPALDLSWMGKLSDSDRQAEEAQDDGKESRSVDRVMALFAGDGMGSGLATAKGTRWGLFNALTQHVDYEMGRTNDTRLDSAWFGRGNDFKQSALLALTD